MGKEERKQMMARLRANQERNQNNYPKQKEAYEKRVKDLERMAKENPDSLETRRVPYVECGEIDL